MGIPNTWREDAQQQARQPLDRGAAKEVAPQEAAIVSGRKCNDGSIQSSATQHTTPDQGAEVGIRSAFGEVGEICGARARHFRCTIGCEAGAARTGASAVDAAAFSAARASALSNLQVRLGGHRGKNAQRPRHAVCLPVLHSFTPSAGPDAWIQENAARSLGEAAPGRRVVVRD